MAMSLFVNLGKDNFALFMLGSGVETVNFSGYDMAIFPRKRFQELKVGSSFESGRTFLFFQQN